MFKPQIVGAFNSATDPCNTEEADMVSQVGTMVFSLKQAQNLEVAGLVLSGGDHADSAAIIPVLDLLRRHDVFSDHKRFICEVLF